MIIKPFNACHLGLLAFVVVAIAVISLLLKNKSEKTKKIVLISLCAFNVIVFFVYKVALSLDQEFLTAKQIDAFNWFDELPLQLCNINMFLIPLGLLWKKRAILSFSFYLAPLGALMAMIFPEPMFQGYDFFVPRICGFYMTHAIIILCGILIATLGFYRPQFKDFPWIALTFILLALGALLFNFILRATGLCSFANYFFTCEDGGVSLLHLFWSWIPIPFIYELPALVILFVYVEIITCAFKLFEKKEKKEESSSNV
ncbi:MAG: YwaF family protein [Clostridia bacterium]|nr:YwaF family protein [Clostridia bacterium]